MKNVQLTRLAPFNFGVVLYSIASPLSVYNNGCQILGLPYAQYADVSQYWSILLHQRTGGVSETTKSENRVALCCSWRGDGTGTNHGSKVEEEGTKYINYTFFTYNNIFTFNQRITLNSHICKKWGFHICCERYHQSRLRCL